MLSFWEAYEEQTDPLDRARLVRLAADLFDAETEFAPPGDDSFVVRGGLNYHDARIRKLEAGWGQLPLTEYQEAMWEAYQERAEEVFYWCDQKGFVLDDDEVIQIEPILRRKRRQKLSVLK